MKGQRTERESQSSSSRIRLLTQGAGGLPPNKAHGSPARTEVASQSSRKEGGSQGALGYVEERGVLETVGCKFSLGYWKEGKGGGKRWTAMGEGYAGEFLGGRELDS